MFLEPTANTTALISTASFRMLLVARKSHIPFPHFLGRFSLTRVTEGASNTAWSELLLCYRIYHSTTSNFEQRCQHSPSVAVAVASSRANLKLLSLQLHWGARHTCTEATCACRPCGSKTDSSFAWMPLGGMHPRLTRSTFSQGSYSAAVLHIPRCADRPFTHI